MTIEITWLTGSTRGVEYAELANESLAITGSSAQSAASPSRASIVSIYATEAARFSIGQNPTASASSTYIGANERRWRFVSGGDKLAGITA